MEYNQINNDWRNSIKWVIQTIKSMRKIILYINEYMEVLLWNRMILNMSN